MILLKRILIGIRKIFSRLLEKLREADDRAYLIEKRFSEMRDRMREKHYFDSGGRWWLFLGALCYRNKLLTHIEENRSTSDGEYFSSLLNNKPNKIYRDIEAAVKKIKDWLSILEDAGQLSGRTSSAIPHPAIPQDAFANLIKSAPELNLE
ncbi:MAG: hypothetical protein AABY64_04410 [Bdellovibrionota bacterium]